MGAMGTELCERGLHRRLVKEARFHMGQAIKLLVKGPWERDDTKGQQGWKEKCRTCTLEFV